MKGRHMNITFFYDALTGPGPGYWSGLAVLLGLNLTAVAILWHQIRNAWLENMDDFSS